MKVYRHTNGGGSKVYPAQASPDSFICPESSAEGETSVYASVVRESALKDTFAADGSRIIIATVADSRISNSVVCNADVASSEIVNAFVERCRLNDCRVFANEGGRPRLHGVSLSGVTVYGDTCLIGPWGLNLPGAHIHAGLWREQPRHLLVEGEGVEGEGVHVAVVECTEGRAHMGCTCRPVTHWLDRGPKLGRRLGWSEEMIETCLTFLKSLA